MKKSVKERASERLFKAAAHWAKVNGGSIIVAGNVHTLKWPGDLKYNYTLGIKCTGVPPGSASNTGAEPT